MSLKKQALVWSGPVRYFKATAEHMNSTENKKKKPHQEEVQIVSVLLR